MLTCIQDGWTPLHVATRNRNKRCMTMLLEHGVRPNIVDDVSNIAADTIHND